MKKLRRKGIKWQAQTLLNLRAIFYQESIIKEKTQMASLVLPKLTTPNLYLIRDLPAVSTFLEI